MVAQELPLASGPFVLCAIPQEWSTEPQTLVISFATEQFRGGLFGRPEIFRSGALLIFPRFSFRIELWPAAQPS